MKDNEQIALSDAAHAESLDELFSTLVPRFANYMDEMFHSDPGNPVSVEQAGMVDAKKTPPEPDTDSSGPSDGSYISRLYFHARNFFKTYIRICEACFDLLESKVDDRLSAALWSKEKFNSDELKRAISDHQHSMKEFKEYKEDHGPKIGSGLLEPTRPSALIFVSFVFFVAVFEFVWVWYFLSEQLGLSAAIYVSMVATTLVIVIAALCAFSHANTAKDLEQVRRMVGYGGIIFCILLFLFGVGLLSGWRADSTIEGFALVVEGYWWSLTKIDVFVTAVINFVGFIFLTREFRRFFWQYPLFHYAERIRLLNDKKAEIDRIKNELNAALKTAEEEIDHNGREIKRLLGIMNNFQRNIAGKLKSESGAFEELVGDYQGEYHTKNLEYRTVAAYKAPAWLDKCTFSVSDGEVRQRMEERFKEVYKEYTNDSNAISEKYKAYRQKRDAAEQEIKAARGILDKMYQEWLSNCYGHSVKHDNVE